jgi:hypothetical protein
VSRHHLSGRQAEDREDRAKRVRPR